MAEPVYLSEGRLITDRGPLQLDPQASGVVDHDWTAEGWGPFTPVVMTAHGAQTFTQTVTAGRGVLAGAGANGNLRMAYLRRGTSWRDATVTTLVRGPTAAWATNNAQQGHLHRVREVSPGLWEGIAIWTSVVFGGDYSFLHASGVRFDGTILSQANGALGFGTADAAHIDRTTRITGHRRYQFGSWFNEYTVLRPDMLLDLAAADVITIAGLADGTFNETDTAIASVLPADGTVTTTETVTTSASAYAATQGSTTVRPSAGSLQKRWCPFWLSTRVVGGDPAGVVIEAKRWRPFEVEPAWSDARVLRGTTTVGDDVTVLATQPGLHGLWGAHFYDGSGGAWGTCRFSRHDGEP